MTRHLSPLVLGLLALPSIVGCAVGGPPDDFRRADSTDGGVDDPADDPLGFDADATMPSCGEPLESCCPGASCTVGQCTDGRCEPCGYPGASCCRGTPCPGGGICSGICVSCGAAGQPCCPGASCDGGLSCVDAVCQASTTAPGEEDAGTADPDPDPDPVPGTPPACRAGATEDRACGNCGTQRRDCQPDGSWGAFDACTGEGVCRPGDTDGGFTCTPACTWNSFNSCAACPSNSHISVVRCDGSCPLSCASAGYNSFTCARNADRFTACGARCPVGYRAILTACETRCLLSCDAGYNAVVCVTA